MDAPGDMIQEGDGRAFQEFTQGENLSSEVEVDDATRLMFDLDASKPLDYDKLMREIPRGTQATQAKDQRTRE